LFHGSDNCDNESQGVRAMSSQPNGSTESLKQRVSEIEDALVVMAHLNTDMSNMLKEHTNFIREHEATITRIDARLDRMSEKAEATDLRIEQLVSAIGQLIARDSQK